MLRLHWAKLVRCAAIATAMALAMPAELISAQSPATPSEAEGTEFFERQVRPLLVEHCQKCHGPKKQEAGLRLDRRDAALKGSDSGPVIVPGKPEESSLVAALRHEDEPKMPPKAKLPQEAIDRLTRWVAIGAPWPADAAALPSLDEAARRHWAFQPPRRPELPAVRQSNWGHGPLDRFVLAKWEHEGVAPGPPADRRTLIRRASFDLLGLPPTYDEVETFARDEAPDAFTRLVDRLLGSPRYGERWGRYWLDVARYADTKGYVFQEDRGYPHAYRYREWVIGALNADLPYDQFLVLQIAADRAAADDPRSLAALGFLTLGRRFLNNRNDIIDDRLDVICRGTMGLTISCARCHDHKFDPIPMADYYSLHGVFSSTVENRGGDNHLAMADAPNPRNSRIFLRGNPGNPGPEVPRQFLAVAAGKQRKPFEQGSGRLELARSIASRDNPLTARVIVNRVWAYHFGAGLVRTPSDFGLRSDPPTHPELLDYLAWQFVEEGWSLKALHRRIMLSGVYQQAAREDAELRRRDPDNLWLWTANRRRLDFEALRDAILATSGGLDATMGGPSVEITKTPSSARRSVYAFIDRQNLPGVFRTFDFASPDTHSPGRFSTTVPQQALFLLNHPLLLERADALAALSEAPAQDDPAARIDRLYRRVLARTPSAAERQAALRFVAAEGASGAPQAPGRAWSALAQVLLLSNEFMFVD